MKCNRYLASVAACFIGVAVTVHADEDKDFFKPPKDNQPKPPAGKAEMLRHMPKKFAAFQFAELDKGQVTFLIEGEKEPSTWPINPDAEIKIHGWWGRLDQFQKGDRVWVWFQVDRDRKPKSILMLADEISQQDIHGAPYILEKTDFKTQTLTVKPAKGESKTFKVTQPMKLLQDGNLVWWIAPPLQTGTGGPYTRGDIRLGDRIFFQIHDGMICLAVNAQELEKLRQEQRYALRDRWRERGLPGTVLFIHPLSGEMEFMLDHEAIRWGRSLKNGDKVTLRAAKPIQAEVKEVRPWRERTQLRLVADGFAQTDLALGQRLMMQMKTPPPEVDSSAYPPDMDRPRTKSERIEWFLASTYCSCRIGGDNCTGMFYTLASCNVHGCGMPNHIRGRVAGLIDQKLNDQQIFDELKKTQGPLMLRSHLLP